MVAGVSEYLEQTRRAKQMCDTTNRKGKLGADSTPESVTAAWVPQKLPGTPKAPAYNCSACHSTRLFHEPQRAPTESPPPSSALQAQARGTIPGCCSNSFLR